MNAPVRAPRLPPASAASPIRYLSVCSGIEAATVAWEPLGWRPIGFAEIAPFPSRVLAARWPHVPNHGDFTAIDVDRLGPIDLLVGGTPCQAFSVAGRRLSLADARGNLSLAFAVLTHELARSRGLRWAVWENVPGVLSTDDNAFGCLLGALVGAGDAVLPCERPRAGRANALWRWKRRKLDDGSDGEWIHAASWPRAGMVAGPRARAAWRVLDAQHFGLAQRRERVFVVVGLGDRADPAAVLFEPQSLRRDPAAGREEGKGVAASLTGSLGRRGGQPDGGDTAGHLIAATLDASFGRLRGCSNQDAKHGHSHLVAFGGNNVSGPIEVATGLNGHGGPHGRLDFATETFIATALRARDGARGVDSDCTDTLVAHSLRGSGFDASEDGTGRGTPLVPVCFDTTQITDRDNRCNPQPGDPCHPLAADAHPPAIAFTAKDHGQDAAVDLAPTVRAMPGWHANGGGQVATAFQERGRKDGRSLELGGDVAFALTAPKGGGRSQERNIQQGCAVRRLTPTECHRLQGFPDDHCAIPGAADGPIYESLGNSMATKVMAWLGRRIDAVDRGAAP